VVARPPHTRELQTWTRRGCERVTAHGGEALVEGREQWPTRRGRCRLDSGVADSGAASDAARGP